MVFGEIADILAQDGYVILDLDLVACYTGIICGLYPRQLNNITKGVKGEGIWKTCEKLFYKVGKVHLYNKPYVKICFCFPPFSGGPKGMIGGVVDSKGKAAGMTTTEFKTTKEFEEIHVVAKQIPTFMESTPYIQELRDLYRHVHLLHENGSIVGPTGHEYPVRDIQSFRKVFPNLLQSYEFVLLAQSSLNTFEKFPHSQLFYHFHDGNVVGVRKSEKEAFLKELSEQVTKVGESLRLKSPQHIELQPSFG